MDKTELKEAVYSIFSDTKMLILALIAVPVTVLELFQLDPSSMLLLSMIDWVIWGLFFLEFILKIVCENDYTAYIRNNKAQSALSIIIVGSPIVVILTSNLIPFPIFGLARALRIFRVLGYSDEVYAKKKKRDAAKRA